LREPRLRIKLGAMRVPKIRKIAHRDSSISIRQPPPPRDRLKEPVWHVWIEGGDPIGPVSADQIARGVQSGKVPSHASVRHDSDTFWGDLLDAQDVVAALKAVSVESEPPPPPPSLLGDETDIAIDEDDDLPTEKHVIEAAQYMVWLPGNDPVGPVTADQIARGIRAGKVPPDASVQRVGDLFSTDALDEPEIIAALKAL
jgi:hypothetical protein